MQFSTTVYGESNMSEPIKSFTTDIPSWRPRISPLNMEEASAEQLESMRAATANTKIGEFTRVLALDPETLLHLTPLLIEIMSGRGELTRPDIELGAVCSSVVNRSIYCAAAHSNQYNQLTEDHTVIDSIFSFGESAELAPRQKALLRFATNLSQCPPNGISSDVACLLDNGLSMGEILDLVLATSLFGWVNRLSQVLGDPVPQE